jgi:tRNA A37 threonylcarbamoyladenosine synthetase subunit TsaC/SUA5/YrdC
VAGDEVPLVAGPDAGGGRPSTVVALELEGVKILREGAIPAAAIATVLAGDPAP